MGTKIDKFYELYKDFAIYLFICQNIVLFLTILVSYPTGEVIVTTNSFNEMIFEIVWTGFLVFTSILFGIIHLSKVNKNLQHKKQVSAKNTKFGSKKLLSALQFEAKPLIYSKNSFNSVEPNINPNNLNSAPNSKVSANTNAFIPKKSVDVPLFSSIIIETKIESEVQKKSEKEKEEKEQNQLSKRIDFKSSFPSRFEHSK